MCRQKFVDYVVTEDMDTLAFGCPQMIRTCLDPSIKRSDIISVIDLTKVLSDFKMTYDQFIDMCILCGCDYCPNIPRIGNKTALKFVIVNIILVVVGYFGLLDSAGFLNSITPSADLITGTAAEY